MATRSNPTWIITQQPREVPFRKGPFYDDKYVEDFLREAYRIYPDIICIVVDGPMDRDWQPQHGYEWLDMNGDRRKRHPRKNRMATSPQPNVVGIKDRCAIYEDILRVVCGHLELPQSESGPADDVHLYDRALEAMDEYSKKADSDLAENTRLRFKAEARVFQLRKVVEELKFTLFSSDMTIKDRADQSARLALATTEGKDNA